MLSLDECREILGDKATGLTDIELAEIRDHFYWLADICPDMVCEDVQLEQGKSVDEIPLRQSRNHVKAVIYCRVSKEQVDNFSLPTQEAACRDYCRRNDWSVAEIFIERGKSAKTADRTGIPEAAQLLPDPQGHGRLRRRLQPVALRAQPVRPSRRPQPAADARRTSVRAHELEAQFAEPLLRVQPSPEYLALFRRHSSGARSPTD